MKRLMTMTLLTTLLFGACEKEGTKTVPQEQTHNRVITMPGDEKSGYSTILVMNIGHNAKDCGGCVMINGQIVHEDCMGDGNYCRAATAVSLNQIGTSITVTTTDTFGLTSKNFFLMPDRSLEYVDASNNYMFLNIPAQLVYRDSTTLQFTFTGLSFTNKPLYSNN
jgi:hypothetical protein